jgi:hypothetical protein
MIPYDFSLAAMNGSAGLPIGGSDGGLFWVNVT